MILNDFEFTFKTFIRNDEILLLFGNDDYISMSTEKCKVERQTSWCNLSTHIDSKSAKLFQNKLSKYSNCNLDFQSNIYFYNKNGRYRLLIQLPDALKSLKENQHLFYSLKIVDYNMNQIETISKVESLIVKHVLGTKHQNIIPIIENQIFNELSIDERKNLLMLFLSKDISNYNLALNILNIL